jgi:hypothetical protein
MRDADFNAVIGSSTRLKVYDSNSIMGMCKACPEGAAGCMYNEFSGQVFIYAAKQGYTLSKKTNQCKLNAPVSCSTGKYLDSGSCKSKFLT